MMNLPRQNRLRRTYKALVRQHKRTRRNNRNNRRTRKYRGGEAPPDKPITDQLIKIYNKTKDTLVPFATNAAANIKSSTMRQGEYLKPFVGEVSKKGSHWFNKNVLSYKNQLHYAMKHVPVFSALRTLVIRNPTLLPNLNLRDVALLSLISENFIRAAFIPIDNTFENFSSKKSNSVPEKMNYHMYSTNTNIDLLISIFGHEKIGKNVSTVTTTSPQNTATFMDSIRQLDLTIDTNTRFVFTLIQSKVVLKEHHEGNQIQAAQASHNIIDVGYLVYKVPFTNEDRVVDNILQNDIPTLINNCSVTPESYLYHSNEIFGFTKHKNSHELNLHPSMIDSDYGVKIHMRQGCKPLFKPGTVQYKNLVPIVYLNITENLIKSPLLTTLGKYDEKEFNANGEYKEMAAGTVTKYLTKVSDFLDANINLIFHAANVIKHTPYEDYTVVSPKIIFTNLLEPSFKVNFKFNNYVAIRVILSHFAQYLLCKGINVYISPNQFSQDKSVNVARLIEYMITLRKNSKVEVSGSAESYQNIVSQYYMKVESFLNELTTILTNIAFKNENSEVWKTVLASIFGLVVLNPYTQTMADLNYRLREQSIDSSIKSKQYEVNTFLLLIKNVNESSSITPRKYLMDDINDINFNTSSKNNIQNAIYLDDNNVEDYTAVGELINPQLQPQLNQEIIDKGKLRNPVI